jgi:hypothetical protein
VLALLVSSSSTSCADIDREGSTLSKQRRAPLRIGQRVPTSSEQAAVGGLAARLRRGSPGFRQLVRCTDARIVFKDEERDGSDRLMTARLRARLSRLAALVAQRWPGTQLRVTEAWDDRREHGRDSLHYEGRAADVTTSDLDPHKLGELARLAVIAGLDWVLYEDETHVHVSVRR